MNPALLTSMGSLAGGLGSLFGSKSSPAPAAIPGISRSDSSTVVQVGGMVIPEYPFSNQPFDTGTTRIQAAYANPYANQMPGFEDSFSFMDDDNSFTNRVFLGVTVALVAGVIVAVIKKKK